LFLQVIEEVDRIYLVTEHVGGGELFNYIVEKGRIEEPEAAKLFAQMVSAVDLCHRNMVREGGWAQSTEGKPEAEDGSHWAGVGIGLVTSEHGAGGRLGTEY
jgi:hypothetical protein